MEFDRFKNYTPRPDIERYIRRLRGELDDNEIGEIDSEKVACLNDSKAHIMEIVQRLQQDADRIDWEIKKLYKIDEDFIKALRYCMDINQGSESLIQSYFPIGYFKAYYIIAWMERKEYISNEHDGASRKILITEEEYRKTFETADDIVNPIIKP